MATLLGTPIALPAGLHAPKRYALRLSGAGAYASIGNDASINNMPAGANGWTVDFWARFPAAQSNPSSYPRLLHKRPAWYLPVNASGNTPGLALEYSGGAVSVYVGSLDSDWHHFGFCYNETGTRRVRAFRDGQYINQSAATSGSYNGDAGTTLLLGQANDSVFLIVDLAWLRFSSTVRWTTSYVVPELRNPPAVDASTLEMWRLQEGAGTSAAAEVSAANDMALVNPTWIAL